MYVDMCIYATHTNQTTQNPTRTPGTKGPVNLEHNENTMALENSYKGRKKTW